MIRQTVYTFSLRSVKILLLFLTGMLFISGLLFTCYSLDMETQLVLFQWDNLLITLPGTALLGAVIYAVIQVSGNTLPAVRRLLRLVVLCWCMIFGIILILFSKSVPTSDSYSVYQIACQLAAGDTSVIHPTQSYLSYYPQQTGLVAFLEPLIRIWNLFPFHMPAYHFIKLIYLLAGCVIIFFQEQTVHLLWKDAKADCLYLVLAGLNFPLLIYMSFIYGEIPSFAAISVGFYLLTRLLTDENSQAPQAPETTLSNRYFAAYHRILTAAGSLFFFTLSVMLRKNSLIFIIAAVIVMALRGFSRRRPAMILLAALCMACSLAILPCIQKFYEYRSGSTISSGVPAISYFAMGMQESSRADGWYNGFNFDTYQNAGMNTEAAVAVSREAIRKRLAHFQENPGYAVRFYMNKYLSQWVDGTYACRQATMATFGGRKPFFVSLYEGNGSKYLIFYCNLYQNILYLGTFWFCLASFRQGRKPTPACSAEYSYNAELPAYLGLIGMLGGFLFHMLWEANARYIFPYGLAMLPCCARGLSLLSDSLSNKFLRERSPRNNKSRRPDATDKPATAK